MPRRLAHWLCPTDLARERVLANSARIERARVITAAAIAVGAAFYAPVYGWWTLALLALAAFNMRTLDRRMARSDRPQLHSVATLVLMQGLVAVSVAFSGGPDSVILSWMVLPTAFSAARFRGAVVIAAVSLGLAQLLAATLAVHPGRFVDRPSATLSAAILMIAVTAVVHALSAAEVEQRGEAVLDPLTGLLNRTSLQRRFEELMQQARLAGEPVALVALDVDHFKAINDQHGHAAGDAVLRSLAYEVRKQLRSFELVYRLGGEELLILLPGAPLQEAHAIAERLRLAIEHARPAGIATTASFGVALADADADLAAVCAHADAALYRAKHDGRNCVRCHERDEAGSALAA
jgi:diguanylate cyclase (GGDEF)-like protein